MFYSIHPYTVHPRLKEAIQVILQALQFKHRPIARVAAETLKLCAEKGAQIARLERLPQLIINSICVALEIQNIPNPKDQDKVVITALLLCLGEFCMAIPTAILVQPLLGASGGGDTDDTLIGNVLRVLQKIVTGSHADRIKLFTADEDFDMSISADDLRVKSSPSEPNYQTAEMSRMCVTAIRLCAKTVAMHLVTNLSHFPMGIGATRLSSIVDEHDDIVQPPPVPQQQQQQHHQHLMDAPPNSARDSLDLGSTSVLNAANLQMFLLNPALVASFIELPALKLPGGGITAGLVTAAKQVRVLLRDLSGKACWDVSILYREPAGAAATEFRPKIGYEKQQFFSNEKHSNAITSQKLSLQQSSSGFQIANRSFMIGASSLDPMTSTFVGMPLSPVRHTLRHRPPGKLPLANDMEPDLDQLDDVSLRT